MLAPEIGQAWNSFTPQPAVRHYLNLSRGLLVNHLPDGSSVNMIRIQSTWCEQKMWARIIDTLPPDFWISMAVGDCLVVHDVSERPRQTRAVWQGLSWIRYAVGRAWGLPEQPELSRSGMTVNKHWDHVYRNLPGSVKNVLKYYGNFFKGQRLPIALVACNTCARGGSQ